MIHPLEGRRDRAPHCQRAVIAQQQMVFDAEILLNARSFIVIERNTFIVMIGKVASDEMRGLVQRLQAFHTACDRRAVGRVQVDDATGVFANFVNRRVNDEAGRIDLVRALGELIAVEIDFHKARCGDFVEHQSVRVDEKMMLRSGHARRDMRIDQIVPAIQCDQPVGGRKIDALRPLRVGHSGFDFLEACFGWRHGCLLPRGFLNCKNSRPAAAKEQPPHDADEPCWPINGVRQGAGMASRLAMLLPRMS